MDMTLKEAIESLNKYVENVNRAIHDSKKLAEFECSNLIKEFIEDIDNWLKNEDGASADTIEYFLSLKNKWEERLK